MEIKNSDKQIKNEIRSSKLKLRSIINLTDEEEKNNIIFNKLIKQISKGNYKKIALYYSYAHEVSTEKLISWLINNDYLVFAPVSYIEAGNSIMDFYRVQSINDFEKGYKEIKEPINRYDKHSYKEANDFDIIVVPLVAFDDKRNRIGYGKGFYDNYLMNAVKPLKIGLAFDFQKCDYIPTRKDDIPLDMIITEERVY